MITLFLLIIPGREQDKLLKRQNEELRQTLSQLQNRQNLTEEASEAVLELAGELKVTAQQQASGIQEHAATINQVNTSMAELVQTASVIAQLASEVSETVKMVAQDSRLIEQTTMTSVNHTKQGFAVIDETAEVSQEVARLYQNLLESMDELNAKSVQMNRVLKIIGGISNETHLLALNAAIEAAGAGEAGQTVSGGSTRS